MTLTWKYGAMMERSSSASVVEEVTSAAKDGGAKVARNPLAAF